MWVGGCGPLNHLYRLLRSTSGTRIICNMHHSMHGTLHVWPQAQSIDHDSSLTEQGLPDTYNLFGIEGGMSGDEGSKVGPSTATPEAAQGCGRADIDRG